MKIHLLSALFLGFTFLTNSQVLTKEDSLSAGLIASNSATVLSGYGSASYTNNLTLKDAEINLDRIVLFVGHKFNKKVSFFSELELEDAKVAGGSAGGEIAMEQAFLKFNINRTNYLVSGLFIPRIGIINENHLPTTFNGNKRTLVETLIIPATWRELGIGYYGVSNRIMGLNYSLALVNGLSNASFTSGNGIREGRFEGHEASAKALALTGSILHYHKNFRSQISAYYGGTNGINKRISDSLNLNSSTFGTPAELLEANVQYHGSKLQVKALATIVNIPDADKINTAYGNNTPKTIYGAYIELAYNFLVKQDRLFRGFCRFEQLDLNYKLPANAVSDPTLRKQYTIAGICYQPVNGVLIKLDYTFMVTGKENPVLTTNPYPQSHYFDQQQMITFGMGYSF